MFFEERQQKILELLNQKSSLKVNELSLLFTVSESTIRRDLKEMEEAGLLSRTHGGAVDFSISNIEPTYKEKEASNQDEKVVIGEIAARMIKNGDTVILDSGTTTLEIAKRIAAKNVSIITNSIDIAAVLCHRENVNLLITGGNLRFTTRAMVGHITEEVLKNFRVDKAFIGANGISLESGITTPNLAEAKTKRAMMNVSNKVIIVADSTKFNKVCLSVIAPASEITSIITTNKVDNKLLKEFENLGLEVITS